MPRSLLLIEDNEDDVFFFQVALKKLGLPHGLAIARDGREAILRLEQFTSGPSRLPSLGLILLDLKLPYISGLDVLAWIRNGPGGRFPPVVVLTASEQEADVQAAYRLGAASVWVKPNRPDQLVELLRALEGRWLRPNRVPPVEGGDLPGEPMQPAGVDQLSRSVAAGVICSTSTTTGLPGAQSALSATNRSR